MSLLYLVGTNNAKQLQDSILVANLASRKQNTDSIQIMELPATAQWGLTISDADFEKLKTGFEPQDMDDKWNVSASELDQSGNISIHISRSWTQKDFYVLVVKPSDGVRGVKVEAITWEQDKGGIYISEDQAKKEAVLLCRSILGCGIDALPEYDPSIFWNHPAAQRGVVFPESMRREA